MSQPVSASEPSGPAPTGPGRYEMQTSGPGAPPEPMTTHRGAHVEVDVRRATRVVVGICIISLFVSAVALFVAGFHDNAQINELRTDGVPIEITVAKCLGLLGGSGSNQAGYACTGSYSYDGHRYVKSIPGDVFIAPGTKIAGIASSHDPSLFTTASVASRERASFSVYFAPIALLAAFALITFGLARTGKLTRRGLVATR